MKVLEWSMRQGFQAIFRAWLQSGLALPPGIGENRVAGFRFRFAVSAPRRLATVNRKNDPKSKSYGAAMRNTDHRINLSHP
jgi:hypothetical protein